MVKYGVAVTTSSLLQATTTNNIFIKLVGTDGESKRTWLKSIKGTATFYLGAVSKFSVSCPTSLGKLVLIEVDKNLSQCSQKTPGFPARWK
ncbi:hypothetical protein PBY51_019848 [Eleginops maclovinus]|uniref:PLAT domain-containing protein n=1 Tax=Eleginops maclovinus TaxID=56733 RepID=A0AAN8AK42_ELEMC|nr:hypothetical protein PBY51_019848 [Eleginops maclovinus]